MFDPVKCCIVYPWIERFVLSTGRTFHFRRPYPRRGALFFVHSWEVKSRLPWLASGRVLRLLVWLPVPCLCATDFFRQNELLFSTKHGTDMVDGCQPLNESFLMHGTMPYIRVPIQEWTMSQNVVSCLFSFSLDGQSLVNLDPQHGYFLGTIGQSISPRFLSSLFATKFVSLVLRPGFQMIIL